jgi:hypothetical protein
VSDAVFEQTGGPGAFNFITFAEWECTEAVEAAKKAVAAKHAAMGFNPAEFCARLGIASDVATYSQLTSGSSTV